jgi:hypothetical protein
MCVRMVVDSVSLTFCAREQVGLTAPNRGTTAGELICDLAEAWANRTLRGGGSDDDAEDYTCSLTGSEARYLQEVAHTAVFGSAPRL